MPTATEKENTNISWLKPGQVEAMRDAAHEGRHGGRDDAILTLMYDTGLRRAELAGVDRDMLDLEERELSIPPRIQKDYPTDDTPHPVTFVLDRSGDLSTVRTLRAWLNDRPEGPAALFPSQKADRMTPKGVGDVVGRCARRADVKPRTHDGRGAAGDVTPHTLRHSVAWRMLHAEEGNTLYDVRKRLRHTTIKTTEQIYEHFERV